MRFKPGNIVFSYRSVDVIGVIDRETGHIVWAWGPGELDGQHKPHVLPNGNTLICEGGKSHLFEVTPEGEIAWDYTSPFKEEGAMATYRCLRYAPEYVEPLLRRIWK